MGVDTSLDLQQRTGDIQRAVIVAPVLITNHGARGSRFSRSRNLRASRKPAASRRPPELRRERGPVVQRKLPDDPLGYDTGDFLSCARAMADAALSGRNRAAVDQEIAGVEKRLTGR